MTNQHRTSGTPSTAWRITATIGLAIVTSLAPLLGQVPALELSLQIGGVGKDEAPAVRIDDVGNLFIAGSYSGTVDFDLGPATANQTSVDSSDIFVAKYDQFGNHLWSFSIGGNGTQTLGRIVLDGSGGIIVRGWFRNTIDVDPGPGTVNLTAVAGTAETFVARYTATGNLLWSFRLPTDSYAHAIAVDGSGDVMLGGYFSGAVDFDPGPGATTLTATVSTNNSPDLFVAKYSGATGAFQWAFRIGGSQGEAVNAIAIDNAGSFYITGYFGTARGSSVNFNPSKGPKVNLSSQGVADMFLAKFGADRKLLWAFSVGGATTDHGIGLATDGASVLVAGMFGGSPDFNPAAGSAVLNAASMQDPFVAKYSSSGAYQWAVDIETPCGSICQGGWATTVAIDEEGDVHVGGNFRGTADFAPGSATALLTSEPATAMNGFAAKYTSAGAYISAWNVPSTVGSHGSLVYAGGGTLAVYGTFQGSADLDPSATTATVTSAGFIDIFVARYGEPMVPNVSVVGEMAGSGLRIGPNPFIGSFSIERDDASVPCLIDVIDMTGRVITSRRSTDRRVELEIGSDLPAGAYVVRVTQGDVSRQAIVHKIR